MKGKWLFAAVAVVAISVCSIGVLEGAITGSSHDFQSSGWTTEICAPCHTPHNADTSVADAPLWDHRVTTVSAYTLYNSSTIDATDIGQPGSRSKLCLSCHDGTVALDSFGGVTGSSFIGGVALIGTDLSNDHPISFTYDDDLATTDGELHAPTTTNANLPGGSGTIDTDMLFNNKMECSSCHDPHGGVAATPMLVKSNTASALCLTCHDK